MRALSNHPVGIVPRWRRTARGVAAHACIPGGERPTETGSTRCLLAPPRPDRIGSRARRTLSCLRREACFVRSGRSAAD